MNKKRTRHLIIALLIPLCIGALSSLLSGNISGVYSQLNKPALSPPGFIFPIVWTILYLLMGLSSYLIYYTRKPDRDLALATYALQLVFNFFWSLLFFRFKMYFVAFIWILCLIFIVLSMILKFYKINKTAAYLQIPYLIWLLFAAYLNIIIYYAN